MTIVRDRKIRPITVEAFRFVHLKNPNLYSGKDFGYDFVTHPDPSSSERLSGVENPSTANMFTALSQVRAINPDLYAFMFWLQENRGKLTQDKLATHTAAVSPLADPERLEVWENLLHQTQIESAPTLVEGLIKLLQADHFLGHYNQAIAALPDGEALGLANLVKAAKASVIIPKQLFSTPNAPASSSAPAMDARSRKILADQLELAMHYQHNKILIQAVEELEAALRAYKREISRERELAYQAYLDQLAQQQANSTPDDPAPTAPDFIFTPTTLLDDAFLQNNISVDSFGVYQHLKTDLHSGLTATIAAIKAVIAEKQQAQSSILKKQAPKTLIHQGISIPLRTRPLNNAFVFKAVPIEGQDNLYTLYLTQYFENAATKVRKVEAFVSTSEDVDSNDTVQEAIYETEHYITLQLFKAGISLSSPDVTFRVYGNFETEDSQYNSAFDYDGIKTNSLSTARTPDGSQPLPSISLPNIYGIMGVKIAEFKKVNQTLCCYAEGEVSHIENILAREYKERETRNLTRSELTTEETSERETENKTDTTTTERHEVQSEISLMLQEDESRNTALSAGVNGSFNYGPATLGFNASGSLNTSTSSSASSNFSESEAYAKEMTQKAVKRIVEKTTYKRTAKMLREYEEKNKHGFDNREGDKHVTGVYRWVDKIYQNDLINYGKRLMYEFTLPEPAKNYKHLLIKNLEDKQQGESCDTTILEKPLSPKERHINTYHDIDIWKLDDLAGYYGIELEEFPVKRKTVAKSFSENFGLTGSQSDANNPWVGSKNFQFKIPEGYTCTGFKTMYSVRKQDVAYSNFVTIHNNNNNSSFSTNIFGHIMVGEQKQDIYTESVTWFSDNIPTTNNTTGRPHEEYLPISVVTKNISAFAMNIWVELEIKQEYFDEIKTRYFAAIWQAYRERLQAYQDALYAQCLEKQQKEAAAQKDPNYNVPSQMARTIEKTEIKRLIIELIMEKVSLINHGVKMPIGRNNYVHDPCNSTLNINTADNYYRGQMHYAKFLEQAFDWEIMAYHFLPYYWADEDEWGDLLSINTSTDHIFLAFLQAGMANVVLPVRPGLEKSVAFLLETGKLWRGNGFILDGQDDLYPAIEQHLQIEVDDEGNEVAYNDQKQLVPVIEASWETRVPSTLTIVQDYSNPLEEEGLPCFCDPDRNNHIGYSPTGNYNLLQGKTVQP